MSKGLCPSVDQKLVKKIARDYDTLNYTPQLVALLQKIFPERNFTGVTKKDLHNYLNEVILQHYDGESVLKYALFKHFQKKNNVAAFEIPVNKSRADFLCINGHSCSFEIKSSLDNFTKLSKQAADYSKVFEYNHVVIDQKNLTKVESLVPNNFGIWSFQKGRRKVHRLAEFNVDIDAAVQVSLLTKKERLAGFPDCIADATAILASYDCRTINERFKKIIRQRYFERWHFIVSHCDKILPIDLQFFFNTNVSPEVIYRS